MADLCLKVQRKREFMNFKNDSPKSGKRSHKICQALRKESEKAPGQEKKLSS